jgi:hypothetical protein
MEVSMQKDTDILIDAAEKEIAKILAKLETETDRVVGSIGVKDIEVTTYSDSRPQWHRRVFVEMKRRPGTRWSQ